MIQIGDIDANSYHGSQCQNCAGLEEMGQFFLFISIFKVRSHEKQDHKHEIIAHLNVIRLNLKGDEQRCNNSAQQVFLPVSQNDTRNRRWNISQRHKLPNVPCRYQNEEIGRKCPYHSAQSCQPGRYSEGPQKDIESEHHNKSQHYIIREKEAINLLHPFQGRCRVVTRRHLIGRHTSKNRIRPARTFSGTFEILFRFLSRADSGSRVMLKQDTTFNISRKKIGERKNDKSQNGY